MVTVIDRRDRSLKSVTVSNDDNDLLITWLKPRTDEQVFLDKFYLLVCTRKN